jgi:hypothetical protein
VVLSVPVNNECTFVSPKPVTRKSLLTVVQDSSRQYTLKIIAVRSGTFVSAIIVSDTHI